MGAKGPENSFGKRGHSANHENRQSNVQFIYSLLFGKRGYMKIGSQMCDLCVPYYLGTEGAVHTHRKCQCIAQYDNAILWHCMEPSKQQPAYRHRVS
jgi:hypothetical protein